ncbi:MAG: MCP four helix bundle domain-containing protein [Deltaproteobacteria bacterium]|nr:MCP four helix bundle domain-containing protein [Deltaproteobacteria bacterium]MBW2075117.1 MCP four helix bundle domain-containing protein [Deltaproteobacteria bacterium]
MWRQISLRARLFLMLAALVVVTLAGGSVTMWYTYQMDSLLEGIIDTDLVALQAAEGLKNALVNQKGFVSYYFLDGNPEWLKKLGEYRQSFKERIEEARRLALTPTDKATVDQIESDYAEYTKNKDRVIALYEAGYRQVGTELHREVRSHFFKILELCESYKDVYSKRINLARITTHNQAKRLRVIVGAVIWTAILLGALLAFVLVTQIFNPLRRLALDGDSAGDTVQSRDEVKAVSRRLHSLIEDVGQTKIELERSQEHLLQSEKLALVGRLAAGMAHSIRNPLTSVKMRLFSIGRMLDLSVIQQEDFDVISEEIRHIDNILQNFLEFSRPPKLKMQKVSPSDVVDMALQLIQHRLESYDAHVKLDRQRRLPEIVADPEQLKEVLVNLLVNACEAMGGGGQIVISEQEGIMEPLGRVVVIRVRDNGPGIPEAIRDKVFEPFFSTKEEGTGLGLSIAARIVEEHGGCLNLKSQEGKGATFTITLPSKERQTWVRS